MLRGKVESIDIRVQFNDGQACSVYLEDVQPWPSVSKILQHARVSKDYKMRRRLCVPKRHDLSSLKKHASSADLLKLIGYISLGPV